MNIIWWVIVGIVAVVVLVPLGLLILSVVGESMQANTFF